MMWPASSLKKPANKSSAGVKLGESLVDIGLLGERVHNLLVESGLPIEHVDGGLKVARERLLAVRDLFDELDRFYEHLLLDPNGFGKFSHTFLVMSGQPIIFDFTVSIGGRTAPIARATLDSAGEQDSNLLGLQLDEGIPVFVRSMSSAIADQIGKALLMDAKTDAGFLPSITLADYLPKGVSIDANPEEKA